MATKERKFSAEVRSDLKYIYKHEIHVELVPDMMRTGKKVYDFYFNYRDHFSGVECKLVDGGTFNIKSEIREHQPESLKLVQRSGGTGVFLICFNKYKTSFILTAGTIELLELEYTSSIKFQTFRDSPRVIEMPRKKIDSKTRWEVERLIDAHLQF